MANKWITRCQIFQIPLAFSHAPSVQSIITIIQISPGWFEVIKNWLRIGIGCVTDGIWGFDGDCKFPAYLKSAMRLSRCQFAAVSRTLPQLISPRWSNEQVNSAAPKPQLNAAFLHSFPFYTTSPASFLFSETIWDPLDFVSRFSFSFGSRLFDLTGRI